ncbi:acyltransferase [Sphingomonas sp. KR3-1]|uniref:acyltransferase family protein n=1 Tax=Sphingomonas sp. KR3-1 TaxID=3156611 RepID=UPI0032B61723
MSGRGTDIAAGRSGGGSHFLALDGLRGVAALFVVAHHVEDSGFDFGLFSRGYLAVDFFFMLSGFVLSHAYDRRFAAGLDWTAFMKLRLLRLWPVMAIGVALGVAVAWGGAVAPDLLAIRAAAALLFIPLPLATIHLFPLNGVQWSLFFELFANALHGGPLKRVPVAALARLLAASVLLLFVVAFLHGDLKLGHVVGGWLGGFARVLVGYISGMLLYRLWCRVGAQAPRLDARWVCVALVAALVAPALSPAGWWWIDPLVVVTLFPAVLWFGATAAVSARWRGLAAASGAISYPLYAFHLPLLELGERLGDGVGGAAAGGFRLAAALLAIALAWWWSRADWRFLRPSPGRSLAWP